MQSVCKPRWQQVTALVSLSASGAITGFTFAPKAPADLTSPTSMPIRLMALEQSARPAVTNTLPAVTDGALRSAVVNVANYYLRMAKDATPAEIEAIIWQHDSVDGVDHGESCAAFASLTLELAAQVVGQQSWVTGGTSYPWPLHKWADVRVDPNPASLGITSVLQDAEAHQRWHPLGDGYNPLPGDWVLFDGHVEVVTGYSGGVLSTVGGDSLPNLSVNAHEYNGALSAQGVTGFVNNGDLAGTPAQTPASGEHGSGSQRGPGSQHVSGGQRASGGHRDQAAAGLAAIPGTATAASPSPVLAQSAGGAAVPGLPVTPVRRAATAKAPSTAPAKARYRRHNPPAAAPPSQGTGGQQSFISEVAPGAMAAQARYGVPAAVTIAQAIDESGWGQSSLATRDNNLFGIKGTGPAGGDQQPTQEYDNGQLVTRTSTFRVYHNVAQSIDDHGKLLATSGYYTQAMADRQDPNAFASALTGVYATDPGYGAKLISLMQQFGLYRYDTAAPAASAPAASAPAASAPASAAPAPAATAPSASAPAATAPVATAPVATAPAASAPATTAPAAPTPSAPAQAPTPGGASIPGLQGAAPVPSESTPQKAHTSTRRYEEQIPPAVKSTILTTARMTLVSQEPLYLDVASYCGISWKILAACDWMQCEAQPRRSPVNGEKLGTVNPDGSVYRVRSEALTQCAEDLKGLARAVYGIDLTARVALSVRDLANVFAAFRWGGLLKLHHTSAMEFPYSVAGLTVRHTNMRWPNINEPNAPDKPGGRFRVPFGAVPVVLSLDYPATV
jgi:flagellum-specific peptidoglycan hydrolase FlgJ